MRIVGQYYGTRQVRRLYLGGRLVWESGTPIQLIGLAESASYVTGTLSLLVLPVMHGISESVSYTKTFMNTLELLAIAGAEESNSFVLATGRAYDADLISGIGKSVSYADSTGHVWHVIGMDDNAQSTSYAFGDGRTCDAIIGSGVSESIFASSNAYSVAADMVSGSSGIEHISYAVALVDSLRRKYILSTSVSTSFAAALAQVNDAITLKSDSSSQSHDSAVVVIFPMLSLDGTGASVGYGSALMTRREAKTIFGLSESVVETEARIEVIETTDMNGISSRKSYAVGTVRLWYLPIEDGNTLEIRQAYDVIEEDDLLEVI